MDNTRSGNSIIAGLLILALFLAGLIVAYLYFTRRPAAPIPHIEIRNFVGKVDVYSKTKDAWGPAQRGNTITTDNVIRTGPQSELDFALPGQINFRLKENSQVNIKPTNPFQRDSKFRLHQEHGVLLLCAGKALKDDEFLITTPLVEAVGKKSNTFRIEVGQESQPRMGEIEVLRGNVEVRSGKILNRNTVNVRELQKAEAVRGLPLSQPIRITQAEWNKVKEAYELCEANATSEQEQLDLSKRAGTYFKYVFDHGTFFTPKIGFAEREFFEDPATKEVFFQVDYDVFPKGSFVGLYTKARNFDLSKFKTLEFEVRKAFDTPAPESFRIEMKSGSGVVKAFQPTHFEESWRKLSVPLAFHKGMPINEVTFVFTNEKVGEQKKGALQFRKFDVIPFTEWELAQQKEEATAPAQVAAPSVAPLPPASQQVPEMQGHKAELETVAVPK